MPLNILNDSGNLLTLGRLVVDNVKPFGEFEGGIMSGKGYYNVSSKEVQIIRISDDIDENTTKVIVNGQEVNFVYDADSKTITFSLEKSPAYGHPWAGQDIKVTLFDTAGNEYSLFEINDVYVGNWFFRFWIFFTVGALAIIVGGLFWWKPWRKNEKY